MNIILNKQFNERNVFVFPLKKTIIKKPNIINRTHENVKREIKGEIKNIIKENIKTNLIPITEKEIFRTLCNNYLPYIKNINIPNIEIGLEKEAVLIEFRPFPHLEFLLRNAIIKLGNNWSYTIVCGLDNYEMMYSISRKISQNIRIIKTKYNNIDVNEYSRFLTQESFWNMFAGEKILLFQEDSMIFNKNIEPFLQYDYVGAPWQKNQNDSPNLVGNGGFSLRTKACMIDVIRKIDPLKTVYNSSTIEYMKNVNLVFPPEDVYFSKNMQELQIGNVADWDTARMFSTESIYSKNSFGGHNFWLSDNNWKKRVINSLYNIKICGVYSPFSFTLGGGEKYTTYMIKYFLSKNYHIIFFNNTPITEIYKTFYIILSEEEVKRITIIKEINTTIDYSFLHYFFNIGNSSLPNIKGIGKINIYHCQFPFDYRETISNYSLDDIEYFKNIVSTYQFQIVNSTFTKEYLHKEYDKKRYDTNIHVVNPVCFTQNNTIYYKKKRNSFVMIGRIFDHCPYSNNKYFDVAINTFNSIKDCDYSLDLIGSVKSEKQVNYLKDLIKNNPNIRLHTDISDTYKNKILKKAQYYIQLTGIKDNNIFCQEHFGIALMEALNYNCYPICFGGYAKYFLKETDYGIIVDNIKYFENIIHRLLYNSFIPSFSNIDLTKYTFDYFSKKIDELLAL
jgi:hypothetical protein